MSEKTAITLAVRPGSQPIILALSPTMPSTSTDANHQANMAKTDSFQFRRISAPTNTAKLAKKHRVDSGSGPGRFHKAKSSELKTVTTGSSVNSRTNQN